MPDMEQALTTALGHHQEFTRRDSSFVGKNTQKESSLFTCFPLNENLMSIMVVYMWLKLMMCLWLEDLGRL